MALRPPEPVDTETAEALCAWAIRRGVEFATNSSGGAPPADFLLGLRDLAADCLETAPSDFDDGQEPDTPPTYSLVYRGKDGPVSFKITNAQFNLRGMLEGASSTVLIGASVASLYLVPFAIVQIACAINDCFTIDLPECSAEILDTLWRRGGFERARTFPQIERMVNAVRRDAGRPRIARDELRQTLHALSKVGCLDRSPDGHYRLVERVVGKLTTDK